MKKILLVEDSKTMQAMMASVLRIAGYTVTICEKGADAYVLAQQDKPDLVLLDLVLPDMDGIKVLSDLRADPATKDLMVAILSGRDSPDEINKGMQLGAIGYLTKHNTMPKMVLEKVKGWIGT